VTTVKTKTRPGDWRAKFHAVFRELAECNREFELRFAELQKWLTQEISSAGPNTSPETQKEISDRYYAGVANLDTWYEQRLIDINERYTPIPYNEIAFRYLTLDQPVPDRRGLAEYLHFHRHGEALKVTEANDAQRDLAAWDKISRTEKDVRRIFYAKGSMKPFQEDQLHRQLLQIVIAFEKEPLTADELAACFDDYCACGKEIHDADSLRKMRNRFEADLRKSAKPL
jgi:hypothetical protein